MGQGNFIFPTCILARRMTTFALCDGMTDIRRLQSRVSGIAPHVQVVAQVLAASVVGVLEGAVVGSEVERDLLVY